MENTIRRVVMNTKKEKLHLSAEQQNWVDETFRRMSVEDKIGQIFCISMPVNDTEKLREVIRRYRPGGFMFRPDLMQAIREGSRVLQETTEIPLLLAANLECGGNGEFEEVFMSKGALIDAEEWIHDRLPFDLSSLPHSGYRKRFLSDGDTIDLGGRVIEVLEAKPAHCCSSLFFLDRTGGNLFSGDELEAGQVLMYINHMKEGNTLPIRERISNMRSNTKRLLDISDEFEWLLPCHNGFPIDKSYIDDFIGLTENILAGKATTEKKLNHPVIEQLPIARLLSRVSYKKASIFMRDTDLHDLSLI